MKAPISLGCDELATDLRIDSQNRRQTFAWHRKVLTCIANWSRTVRESFKHVIHFCTTKIIAKPHKSRTRRQHFADALQGSFRDMHNATNMRHRVVQSCDARANVSRLSCECRQYTCIYTRQKKKRIQLHFPIFLKITIHSVILFTLLFSALIE